MEFSEDIKNLLAERFPGKDIYSMSKEELMKFREDVEDLRHEYSLLELGNKTLGNAAYGSCGNEHFYFYRPTLAADITGECRNLTKTMWNDLEHFFHETLWERKDIQEKFGFELNENMHDWYRSQPISIYSDTDSVYTTYGTLFKAMTPESQKKLSTDEAKLDFIIKFNKEFLDKQNNEWCDAMYNPRHGRNIHEFELETVSKILIGLKKKKYIKAYVFVKGRTMLDNPKVAGTGIEIIKSTTPALCREILTEMMRSLMFDYDVDKRQEYILEFNNKLAEYRRKFYQAPLEDISQSVGVGEYMKYVIDDKNSLVFEKHVPVSVQAIARYNYLAHQNGQDNLIQYSGKIKYYNISIGKEIGYFGYPAGQLPEWAPPMNKGEQWRKTIIEPINRFLEVMDIPKVCGGQAQQMILF